MFLGLVASALLPILYRPVSNPVAIHWLVTKGNMPMTPEVSARAELAAKAIPFGRELLLVVGVLCLSSIWGPPMDQFGWNMKEWARMLAVGILVGLGWLLVYVLILMLVRPTKSQLREHRYLSGTALYWTCLYSGAAVGEELWRGYCLTVLGTSHAVGSVGALLVTSIAFGLAHSRPVSKAIRLATSEVPKYTTTPRAYRLDHIEWLHIGNHMNDARKWIYIVNFERRYEFEGQNFSGRGTLRIPVLLDGRVVEGKKE